MRTIRIISLLFLTYVFSQTLTAQSPSIQLRSTTPTRLASPTFATNAGDGTGRMWVLEQAGRIQIIPHESGPASVFLDISDRVQTSTERGLLGLAFHPQFAENHRFFIDYTRKPDGAVVVAEYHASALNPDIADKQETVILTIPHAAAEHNGGMLAFGPDGFFYISVGDGGTANDPSNNAQNLNSLLGKILRINIDQPGEGLLYSSPKSNPFFGTKPGRDEIYAYGFRNPWRFSFDPVTGELYVGDVGQDAVEEIDVVDAGGNYGWRVFEGFYCTNLGPAACIPENYISAIHTYVHTGRAGRCAVTGGYVYRGNKQTFPFGAYVFGDYCTGEILMFYRGEEKLLLDTTKQLTSFGVDEEGEFYAVGGTVDRITNTGGPFTPTTSFTMAGGGGVSFDTAGTGDEITVDHAQIHRNGDGTEPAGLAVIGLRKDGVLINEAVVPATSLITNGRLYGEVGSQTDTGVAFANPDMARASNITFKFTDAEGNDSEERVIQLPPGGQLAAFLDQEPFFGPSDFRGSVTFESSIPISVVALRGILNERAEFLTTTLPVVDLQAVLTTPVTVPHVATGGGWTTEILLLNATDQFLTGTVRFFSSAGEDQTTTVDDINESVIAYAIPPRSSRKLRATGMAPTTVGSCVITPDSDQAAPAVATVYAYANKGVTISVTGSAAAPAATEFTAYVQLDGALGAVGSIQTGIAVANPSSEPVEIAFELVGLDGSFSGVSGKFTVGPNGQRGSFVRELPGAGVMASSFRGVLRLSSSSAIAALAIRGRYNERGEFLLSTTPPADTVLTWADETFIPQIVDGAGYSTEIVIYDLDEGNPVSGNIYFFDQDGRPVDPELR